MWLILPNSLIKIIHPESQERITADTGDRGQAKLMAHTELLGPLTEDADRRLQVAAKGVVQRYMELKAKTRAQCTVKPTRNS